MRNLRSARAYSGRQNTRFNVTTNRLRTTVPSTVRWKSPALGGAGDIGAEPVRGQLLLSPQLATSATMLAFQEPPEAVIAPVT